MNLKRVGWLALILGCPIGLAAQERERPPLPENVLLETDIEYGRVGERPLVLDIVRPRDTQGKPRPVVVYIHGGGWRNGSKNGPARGQLAPLAAEGGYIGVSVGYRLSGEAIWPAQIHDCKQAIRWLKENAKKYNLDPERIGVWGSSAGGHLVSLLGTSAGVSDLSGSGASDENATRVACVVDYCGPANFLSFAEQNASMAQATSPVGLLFGGPLKEHEPAGRAASPVTYVTPDDPPFLVVHGTDDRTVPFAQAEELVAALQKAKVPVTLVRIEGGGHGIGGPAVTRRVRAFLDKHLKGADVEVSAEPIKAEKPTG